MTVLTISREYGSDGRHIAEAVAQALGYHFVNKRTIEQILIQYGFAEFYKEYETTPSFWDRLDPHKTELISMLNRVLRGLARHGNAVILGRGSFAVLHDLADVLNVRIKAPLPLRVKRVMQQQGIFSPEQALTIDEAMYAHTMAGAYVDFAEAKKGSLESGKFADLVVWHDNPYSAVPADLANLKIDMTTIGGKVVYQA